MFSVFRESLFRNRKEERKEGGKKGRKKESTAFFLPWRYFIRLRKPKAESSTPQAKGTKVGKYVICDFVNMKYLKYENFNGEET